jgi:hypothetical protein
MVGSRIARPKDNTGGRNCAALKKRVAEGQDQVELRTAAAYRKGERPSPPRIQQQIHKLEKAKRENNWANKAALLENY